MSDRPLPRLMPRRPDSHKGDFGRALLVGGSRGMSGAIALAGKAALRGGAGLVQLAVPDCCLETVAAFEPSYMTASLPHDEQGRIGQAAQDAIARLAENSTVVACGPGLGRSSQLDELVAWMYTNIGAPLVLDADALNALASQRDLLERPGGPRVLTPHPGEFRRLVGGGKGQDRQDMIEAAQRLARRCGVVVVLKGHGTVVTDGSEFATNTTGNPGMATGGTGDVLTGVITGLLAQGLEPIDAAHLGVYLHGAAGDLAAEYTGEVSLIASDLLDYLPAAFQKLQ